MSASMGQTEALPIFDFDTGGGNDQHPATGLFYAAAGGHALVSAATPLPVTAGTQDTDDDSIATGQTTGLEISIGYFSNLDNASIWERITGRDDDNAIPSGDASQTTLAFGYVHNGVDWIRQNGAANNAAAPAAPQGAFIAGIVRTSFDVFAAADAAVPQVTVDGAYLGIERTQEPFEVANSQAAIAAAGTFASASIQQNSLFAGSLGRTLLHGFVNYTGAATSLTISVQISLDAGVTFITTDTFTVVSGVATVIRELPVSLGTRVKISILNNDGASGTGVTNIGFYLTWAN